MLCAAEKFSEGQRALLMSAFFPGYILTQIPGSFAIQKWGAKVVMSIDMLVTSSLCLAIPFVTRSGGPSMLAPLLTIIGLSHGPLIPALQVLKKDWLKPGPVRFQPLFLHFLYNFLDSCSVGKTAPARAAR